MKEQKPKILYVDDEKENLNAFKSAFRFDYNIFTALSAQEALQFLDDNSVQIIMADQRMPDMTGVQFLGKVVASHSESIRMIITGYSDIDAIIDAINNGRVFRYIAKPWDAQELKMTLDGAIKLHTIRQENKRLLTEQKKALEFVRIASHDLREPVRTIGSFMNLLKKKHGHTLDGDANTYIDFAIDASQRMHKMIKEILDNPLSSKDNYSITSVDMNEVVEEVLTNLSLKIQEKNATISYPTLPTVQSNHTALVQVIQNLVSNSIKYCNATANIQVNVEKKQDHYLFSLQDNGIGMSIEDTQRIFDIFERLHKTEEHYSGKGIGLSICKQTIEHLQGKIWAESKIGEGSTFFFTIPH